MDPLSSLALTVGRAIASRRAQNRSQLKAALIPPALPGSLGDAAMLSAGAAFLRSRGFAEIDLIFGKSWPLDAQVDHRINAERLFFKGSQLQLAALLPRFGGYSHVYFVGADVIDGAYSPRSVCGRLALLGEAAQLGASATILGSSFNALPNPTTVNALRAMPSAVTICARDPVSRKRMEEHLQRPIRQVADVAFLLDPLPDSSLATKASDWVDQRKSAGDRVIGLNANFLHAVKHTALPGALAALLRGLLRQDISILLVPHDVRTEKSDERLLADAAASLDPSEREHIRMMRPESPGAIKAVLAGLDLIVTGRMHAAILGMGGGTPAFCFGYQDKFEGMFELFGLEDSGLLSTPEALIDNPSEIAAKALAHLDNSPALRTQIETRLPVVTALAERNFE